MATLNWINTGNRQTKMPNEKCSDERTRLFLIFHTMQPDANLKNNGEGRTRLKKGLLSCVCHNKQFVMLVFLHELVVLGATYRKELAENGFICLLFCWL